MGVSARGNRLCSCVLVGALGLVRGAAGEVTTGRDADTRLRSWTWTERGVSVQLVQRLPDQTRAFFIGRGFGREDAERIADACVFQTIFRNDGGQPVEYDINDWSVTHAGEHRALRTRERWDMFWEAHPIEQPQRIALRWSLLPTVQRFEPGDYNWGMTSFGLPPGESFDLLLRVRIGGEGVSAEIESIRCATDR